MYLQKKYLNIMYDTCVPSCANPTVKGKKLVPFHAVTVAKKVFRPKDKYNPLYTL